MQAFLVAHGVGEYLDGGGCAVHGFGVVCKYSKLARILHDMIRGNRSRLTIRTALAWAHEKRCRIAFLGRFTKRYNTCRVLSQLSAAGFCSQKKMEDIEPLTSSTLSMRV